MDKTFIMSPKTKATCYYYLKGNQKGKMWNASRICVSSLRPAATPLPHKIETMKRKKKLKQIETN